jgi:hypothetical protein
MVEVFSTYQRIMQYKFHPEHATVNKQQYKDMLLCLQAKQFIWASCNMRDERLGALE